MAKATINLPNAFLDTLTITSNRLDEFADATLKAAAAVVEPRLRANLAAAIGKTKMPSKTTGQLLAALGTTSVKVNSEGRHNIKVGFGENRVDGRSNALIANVLEYGRSNQAARPFLAPTRTQTRRLAVEAMKQTLAARIGGLSP